MCVKAAVIHKFDGYDHTNSCGSLCKFCGQITDDSDIDSNSSRQDFCLDPDILFFQIAVQIFGYAPRA